MIEREFRVGDKNGVDIAKLTILVMEGKNQSEIAAELGVSASTVYRIVKEHNLKIVNKKVIPAKKDVIDKKEVEDLKEIKEVEQNILPVINKNSKINDFINMIAEDEIINFIDDLEINLKLNGKKIKIKIGN